MRFNNWTLWLSLFFRGDSAKILRSTFPRTCFHISITFATLPLYLLGYLIPKKKDLWIFGNFFGYCDSARYLFEYVQRNYPEIQAVWIHFNAGDAPPTSRSHCFRFSLSGLIAQYRAGLVFLSTGKGDVARFTLAGKTVIQLWHGIPIKRILLDSASSVLFGGKDTLLGDIARNILRNDLNRYALIIASSATVQQRLCSAFGIDVDRIAITGYPRHDIILSFSGQTERCILYAPTWRENLQDAETIVRQICNPLFVQKLKKLGFSLQVSIHPLNHTIGSSLRRELGNDITFVAENDDVNIVLARSEVLITDYSSVAIDFSILNRPLIFFAPDLDAYLSSRGVYPEFESIIRQNAVTTPDSIFSILQQPDIKPVIDEKIYFQWHDSLSRKRIVALVQDRFLNQNSVNAQQ